MGDSSHTHDQDIRALADQNRLLTEEIRRRVNQLSAINTVAATVSQSLNLDVTLQTALDAALAIIHVEAAGISLVDEEAGELVLRAQRGWNLDFVTEPMRIPLGQGLSGEVIADDRVIITGDLTDDDRLAVPAFLKEEVRAMAMAPMHARGRVVGILSVMSHKPYTFAIEEVDVLRAIADQVGIALDNARLYEQARDHEKRLSAIIHSVADAIIATDNNGRISLINHAARALFDLQAERVIGMTLAEAPFHPALREGLERAMQQHHDEATAIFDVTLHNGRTLAAVTSRLKSATWVGQEGPGEGWVIVLQDVTHLKRAGEARTHFIQAAAHDLRNPLGVTLSALVMLEDCTDICNDPSAQEIMNVALISVNRMQSLLDDLLNLEHIESGENFRADLLDPRSLLAKTLDEMRPVFHSKAQSSALDLPEDLPRISLDVQWFERALLNYLSNASKYTQPGGHIVLRARVQGNELRIEVQDNGPGIPVEAQGRLFERFYRAPSVSEETRGSGLGLAIVKSIADAHGGRAYARSQPGQGSTFGLALPIPAPEQGAG